MLAWRTPLFNLRLRGLLGSFAWIFLPVPWVPHPFVFCYGFHCGVTYRPLDVLVSKCTSQRFLINVVQLSQFNFSTFWSPICSHFWFLFGNGKPGSSFPTISWESWSQRKEPRDSSFKLRNFIWMKWLPPKLCSPPRLQPLSRLWPWFTRAHSRRRCGKVPQTHTQHQIYCILHVKLPMCIFMGRVGKVTLESECPG